MSAPTDPRATYQQYAITRTIRRKEGKVAIPVANGDVEVVDLYQPVETLIVRWVAHRLGGPPVVPSRETRERGLTLIESEVLAAAPMIDHESKIKLFQMEGIYTYVINRADGFDGDFATGRCPWDPDAGTANAIPAANFSKDLVGSSAGAVTAQTFTT